MYIWEQQKWPDWQFNLTRLARPLAEARYRQGHLIGRMETLGFSLQDEAELSTLTLDVVKSSEIEGENLNTEQVRSSLARRLGMDIGALAPTDRNVEGVVEMMLDATRNYDQPLTKDRLFAWHGALFPTGRSGLLKVRVADWRDDSAGPMQVVSGVFGHERVHYQAPPASSLEQEMNSFLSWFNSKNTDIDLLLKAGLAHLWFVTLHPFDDGNGRIARAVGDMAMARSEGTSRRFYSLSAQIRRNRNSYYEILEQTQKQSMDVTPWLEWFLDNLCQAMDSAEDTLAQVLTKSRFWEQHKAHSLNQRQIMMINRLLDGFEGKLTSSKWAKLAKCSQDTALRDITALLECGILYKTDAAGRSTGYELFPSI
jgi:Fic family protein